MTTHFITAEVPAPGRPAEIPDAVEAALQVEGEPLRWAITAVNPGGRLQVEAVVLRQETPQPQA